MPRIPRTTQPIRATYITLCWSWRPHRAPSCVYCALAWQQYTNSGSKNETVLGCRFRAQKWTPCRPPNRKTNRNPKSVLDLGLGIRTPKWSRFSFPPASKIPPLPAPKSRDSGDRGGGTCYLGPWGPGSWACSLCWPNLEAFSAPAHCTHSTAKSEQHRNPTSSPKTSGTRAQAHTPRKVR